MPNVGIGTNAPSHFLHLNGPSVGEAILRLTNTDNTQDTHIRYDTPNNSANYWLAGADDDYGDDFLWYNSTLGKVAMNIERGTNYIKIGDGGGAILPLHVEYGLATNRVAHFYNSDTGNDSDGIQIRIGPTTNPTTTNDFIQFQDGDGTVIGQVEGNGAGSVNYSTTSDRRLKKDIQDTRYSLDDLLKIQVRDYSYKTSDKKVTGFIAQELYEVYPEAVSRPENEDSDFWGVDYGKLTPLLVKAVQDIYAKIFGLEGEMKSLKESNAAKDREIAELKARLERIEKALNSKK